jgi:hypothetical protein
MANPKMRSKMGKNKAEMAPPAPNNDHQKGSKCNFIGVVFSK